MFVRLRLESQKCLHINAVMEVVVSTASQRAEMAGSVGDYEPSGMLDEDSGE
jgi:hypothetical protein